MAVQHHLLQPNCTLPTDELQTLKLCYMKKSLTLAGLTLLAFTAFAQVQATKCQCSYFMPFFWEFSYPGMFQAKIDPATETMTITPLSNSFKGIAPTICRGRCVRVHQLRRRASLCLWL